MKNAFWILIGVICASAMTVVAADDNVSVSTVPVVIDLSNYRSGIQDELDKETEKFRAKRAKGEAKFQKTVYSTSPEKREQLILKHKEKLLEEELSFREKQHKKESVYRKKKYEEMVAIVKSTAARNPKITPEKQAEILAKLKANYESSEARARLKFEASQRHFSRISAPTGDELEAIRREYGVKARNAGQSDILNWKAKVKPTEVAKPDGGGRQ